MAGGYHVTVSSFRYEHELPDAHLSVGGSDGMVTLVLNSPQQKSFFSNKMECFGVLRVALTDRLEPHQHLYVTYDGEVVGEASVPYAAKAPVVGSVEIPCPTPKPGYVCHVTQFKP